MLNRRWCLAAVLVLSCAVFAAPVPTGGYSVIKKIPIAGSGSWDYLRVDEAARRLYVSHGTQVEVLDIDALAVVGNIPKMAAKTMALDRKTHRLFLSAPENGQFEGLVVGQ
jgi:hypothetical protein